MNCEACIHKSVCRKVNTAEECNDYKSSKDLMPCQIGDKVFLITDFLPNYAGILKEHIIVEGTVTMLTFKKNGRLNIRFNPAVYSDLDFYEQVDKLFSFSKERAEVALEEMKRRKAV